MTKSQNLWGGRFTREPDPSFTKFNNSFSFDRRLFEVDIRASLAHCVALVSAGVINEAEGAQISDALNTIRERGLADADYFDELDAEDVHSFVEARLVAIAGDVGRKLHTGRSRNDQVATDLRLWVREAIEQLGDRAHATQEALLNFAERNANAVMPGYTHLQRAQPLLFAHWCLAYFEMLRRDRERLSEIRERVNVLPLGSAALAGTSFPIDREMVARELGFAGVSRNSVDAVSDRDFCVEFAAACAIVMVHLSRLAEEIILYSSSEFGFFILSDAVATGSSLMPQKKNPDSMELVRGKAGRVFGDVVSLLTMLKGLPLAYNKDMQEDKEAIFEAFDTTQTCLEISTIVLGNVDLDVERMRAAASKGMMNATELADYLVRKGTSFREAHELVGKIVVSALAKKVELNELPLSELQSFSDRIESDVFASLTLEQTLAAKDVFGGTAPDRVNQALLEARDYLS
jgi:argininosuccinate lyase